MPQFIVPVIIAIAAAATTAVITTQVGKGTAEKAIKSGEKIAGDQLAYTKLQVEKNEQDALQRNRELAEQRDKELRIQAQQFHIETLADLIKGKQSGASYPVLYQTASPKQEQGLLNQINSFFSNIFGG